MRDNFSVYKDVQFHHHMHLSMRWGDMDAYGHVNNALYLRYLESARFAYFEQHCLPLLQGKMPRVVLADIRCRFEKEIIYPSDLVIKNKIVRLGQSSFDFYSRIEVQNVLRAQALATMVWMSNTSHRPMPIPADVYQHLQSLESLN